MKVLRTGLFIAAFAALGLTAGEVAAVCGYSGQTFVRAYDWTDDAAAAVPLTALRFDEEADCVATALSSVVKLNGDSTMSGSLAMGTNLITGLAPGVSGTDAANVSQTQLNLVGSVAAGGTVDVITATPTPSVGSLQDKMILRVIASGANTSATPTFSPNGLTARTIVKHGGQALIAGDIAGAEHVLLLQYDLGNTRWELLNPAWGSDTTAFATTFLDDSTAAAFRTTTDTQEDIMTSRGDLVTRNASATARVAIGSANRFLQSDGTDFAWGQVNLAESDVTGLLPQANISVYNGSTTDDTLDQDSDFVPYYDAGGTSNDKSTLRRISSSGYLETQTASNSASITFALDTYTGTQSCTDFRVILENVLPATAATALYMRTATDGTPTFESGASDYAWNYLALAAATGVSAGDNADSEMQLAHDLDETSPNGVFGEIYIANPSAAIPGNARFQMAYYNDTGNTSTVSGQGRRLTAADVTDIQFIMASGNIASGSFHLYCERR